MDEICWEGKFLRIRKTGRWEWAQRCGTAGGVNIVPLTEDDQLVLIEQFRVPMGRRVLEWAAGLVGDENKDETALEAARRELLEECGYTAETWIDCGRFPSSAGMTDECNGIVLALGAKRVAEGGGVDHEQITTHCVPRSQIDAFIQLKIDAGLLVTPHLFAGLYLLERYRK
ncbi:MAG: NUDIX hydrolase [Thermoguttaceae bacterium]|nr:NUDIX hydrolase [Thermoguttaceae bacterium]